MVVRVVQGGGGLREKKAKKAASIERGCLGRWVILPDSPGKLAWDIACIALLVYAVVVTPLKLGFGISEMCPNVEWIFDLTVDCFFMLDLFLNFFTAAWITDEFGEHMLSGNLKTIAWQYLKSWFLVDLLSSLPIDAVVSVALEGCSGDASFEASSNATREEVQSADDAAGLLRMVRLLRMIKLLKN